MNIYKQFFQDYLKAGISVIPDRQTSHAPWITGWNAYCDKLPTIEEAAAFIADDCESNIAVCLGSASGLIGLDLDCTDPNILDLITPLLPPSPVEKIGSKGFTRFFRYMNEDNLQFKYNGEVVIEILSAGKKTTIPPSIHHKTGEAYKWTSAGLLDVDLNSLPLLPPFLIAHIQDKIRQVEHIYEAPSVGIEKNIVNGRTHDLSKLVMQLIEERVDLQTALKRLIQQDEDKNVVAKFSDLKDQRQPDKLTNALKFYADHLITFNTRRYKEGKMLVTPFVPAIAPALPPATTSSEKKAATVFLTGYNLRPLPVPSGILGEVYNYILKNSFVKQPSFAFSAAVLLLGTLISRKVIFQGVSPNLYALNIGSSGSGKDAPQQIIKRILTAMGAEHYLGSGDYVSDASLMESLGSRPVRLDLVDEASGLLGVVNGAKNGYDTKMADILCELYTTSNDKFLGRTTAEGTKGDCYRPNVSILASTTPKGLEESVSRRAIDKGLLGRFLLFFGQHDQPSQRIRHMEDIPQSIISGLQFWASYKPISNKNFGKISQEWTEIGVDADGEIVLDQYFNEFDNMRRSTESDNPLLPIIARLYQMMLKLSLIHACSRMIGQDVVVNADDIEFAHESTMHYFENMKQMISLHIYENLQEAKSLKLLTIIRAYPAGIAVKEFAKKAKFVPKKEREAILYDMQEMGDIEIIQLENGDRLYKSRG